MYYILGTSSIKVLGSCIVISLDNNNIPIQSFNNDVLDFIDEVYLSGDPVTLVVYEGHTNIGDFGRRMEVKKSLDNNNIERYKLDSLDLFQIVSFNPESNKLGTVYGNLIS